MIDLSDYKKEREIVLPGGVKATCKPMRLRDMQFLRESAADIVSKAIVAQEDVESADAEVFGLPKPTDGASVRAHQTTLFVHELARSSITKWTGVQDNGKDLPATHENIDAYFDYVPGAAESFLIQYMAPYVAVDDEGNEFGSELIRNGAPEPSNVEIADENA